MGKDGEMRVVKFSLRPNTGLGKVSAGALTWLSGLIPTVIYRERSIFKLALLVLLMSILFTW